MGYPGYVRPEDRDTRYYLWTEKYHCRVSNLHSMSKEYVRHFGMPVSGDPRIDRETANELVDRMLSVNQMMEYWEQGVNVRVVKYADTKRIYERIADHLNAWIEELRTRVNTRNVPLDDLLKLDQFAQVVYDRAKFILTEEIQESLFAKNVRSVRMPMSELLKRPTDNTPIPADPENKDDDEVDNLPKRASLADVFNSHRPGYRPPKPQASDDTAPFKRGTTRWN